MSAARTSSRVAGCQRGRLSLSTSSARMPSAKSWRHRAADAGDVFEAERVRQRQVPCLLLHAEAQHRGRRRAARERTSRRGDPRIGVVDEGRQAERDVGERIVAHRPVDQVGVRAKRRCACFVGHGQSIERVAQLRMIAFGVAGPSRGRDRVVRVLPMLVRDRVVGEPGVAQVGRVERRAGQREEQAATGAHPREEPAAADVGIQPDRDLRHREPRARGDDAMRRADEQADTAAHDDAVTPAEDRLRIRVDAMVESILALEEGRGLDRHLSVRRSHRPVQRDDVAPRTERLVAARVDDDAGDRRVARPRNELRVQSIDHVQRQRVQALDGRERRPAEAVIGACRDLVEPHAHVAVRPFTH